MNWNALPRVRKLKSVRHVVQGEPDDNSSCALISIAAICEPEKFSLVAMTFWFWNAICRRRSVCGRAS